MTQATPATKEMVWKDRIKTEAEKATAQIIERIGTVAAIKGLSPFDRKALATAVSEELIRTMLRLGSFVSAGAQDFIGAKLDQVVIGSKLKLALTPKDQPDLLRLLAANAQKDVTIAFMNVEAYELARDALVVAIHRDQMDWLDAGEDPVPLKRDEQGRPELQDAQTLAEDQEFLREDAEAAEVGDGPPGAEERGSASADGRSGRMSEDTNQSLPSQDAGRRTTWPYPGSSLKMAAGYSVSRDDKILALADELRSCGVRIKALQQLNLWLASEGSRAVTVLAESAVTLTPVQLTMGRLPGLKAVVLNQLEVEEARFQQVMRELKAQPIPG